MGYKQDVADRRRETILRLTKQGMRQVTIAERLGVSRGCVAKQIAAAKERVAKPVQAIDDDSWPNATG